MIANSHEELLKYYQSELTYLRRMGGVFAERYPSREALSSDAMNAPIRTSNDSSKRSLS